ncbi:MAG: hypothetical protein M3140_06105 [Actinomycetota bacterium]|nr:hypothetical protein [Actinomycetota bacterium]
MRFERAGSVVGVALYCLVAASAAVYAVLLVPLRVGTVLAPVSVVLGVVTNVALPVLTGRLADHAAAAAAPVGAWFLTVVLLAGSRPEGDVLLPGSGSLVYVFYALVGFGLLAGVLTVGGMENRRRPRRLRAGGSGQPSVPAGAPRPEPPR